MPEKGILITPQPRYLASHSQPEQKRFVFAYTITIRNFSAAPVQLLERRWLLTDGDGNKSEVQGPGVVGEQPHIGVGEEYSYTSSAAFETPVGFMQGSYLMQRPDGTRFEAPIAPFRLAKNEVLN